jgi:hypothetical protein
MRLTTDRSWRPVVALAAVSVLIVAGCNDRPKGAGLENGTPGGPGSQPVTARQAADKYLKSLGDGEASPYRLTDNFLRAISPPVTEDDKKFGYSLSNARDWLARFQGTKFVVGEETEFAGVIVLRGRAESGNKREAFALRMTPGPQKEPDGFGGFKVDWLHRSERQGSEIKKHADPELAAAQDAVRNFVDVLLGGDLRQAGALMTPAWRKTVSPPHPADERAGLDHNPGFLIGTLKTWKDEKFIGYAIPKAELSADRAAATFTANLDSGDHQTPYTVKAAKDKTTGWWLIEAFSKQ